MHPHLKPITKLFSHNIATESWQNNPYEKKQYKKTQANINNSQVVSEKRTLYLPQSHANSRHSFFKMPSFGLPKILEQTINNILKES